MFATRTIRRGDRVKELNYGAEIAPRYDIDGTSHDVDSYLARANVAGLLVIRDGRIVLERYSLGLDPATRWSSMSTIKRDGNPHPVEGPYRRYRGARR